MCVIAQINDPELLPYGAFAGPDSFVIHDRRYRPIVRLAAHEDQDEPCEGWDNLHLPGGINCLARGGWPAFIRVVPETARAVEPSQWIEHDKDNSVWFYDDGTSPDRDEETRSRLQELIDRFPEIGAEIQRRDKAAAAAEQANKAEIQRLEAEFARLEAQADAEFAAYERWIAAGEPAADLLAAEHRERKKRITRGQIEREHNAIHKWAMAAFARDVELSPEQDAAFSKEWDDKLATWRSKHADVMPQIFTDDFIVPPGSTIQEMDRYLAEFAARKAQPSMPLPDHPNLTAQQAVALDDFYACLPAGAYIFTPTREMWPATSVNSRIGPVAVPMREKPIQASTWLATHRAVEQMTWAPGRTMVIADKLIADGGWINRQGCSVFNLYRAPTIRPAAGDASPWVRHIEYVFEGEASHIIKWLAQRVQRPEQKINHALVLGGPQGIGKDTMLEPIKQAIGPWNFTEVSPIQMLGRFNGFVKSVILRISEARDLGDVDRYGFYEHTKTLTAAPPDVIRVDEKHLREHAVLNVCGVIITTNNKDSMHLPADDRRHFVAWSTRTKDDFKPNYWNALYGWFADGGTAIVAHYLATLDLSDFDAKAPPPKTQAFWEMVDSSRAAEDAEMADAIDALGKPDAVTAANLLTRATPSFGEWLQDRRNRRKIPHRFEECGYAAVRNPSASDGYWVVNGKRAPVYAKRDLSPRDQIAAAERLSTAGLPLPPLPSR